MLLEDLTAALADQTIHDRVRFYAKFSLLVIDEFGFDRTERAACPEAASLWYKIIDARSQRSSTALVTNIDFESWATYLGDAPLAMAPSAKLSRITLTMTRVPLMQTFPWQMLGSALMRSRQSIAGFRGWLRFNLRNRRTTAAITNEFDQCVNRQARYFRSRTMPMRLDDFIGTPWPARINGRGTTKSVGRHVLAINQPK